MKTTMIDDDDDDDDDEDDDDDDDDDDDLQIRLSSGLIMVFSLLVSIPFHGFPRGNFTVHHGELAAL